MADPTQPATEGAKPAPTAPTEAALIAELKALDTGDAPKETTTEVTKPEKAPDGEKPKEEPADKTEDPAKAEAEAAKDPDIGRRLEVLNRAKKRHDQQLAADRATLDKDKAEVTAQRAEVDAYRKAQAKAKADPVAVLKSLGIEPTVDLAKIIFAATSEAPPHLKEQANVSARARDVETRLEELDRKFEEREKALTEREQKIQADQALTKYRGELQAAVGDATPLIKRGLAKNPERVIGALEHVARRMMQESGEVPSPAEVAKEYERALKDDLAIWTDTQATKPKDPEAGEKQAASKTLGNDLNTPSRAKTKPRDRREEEAEVLARLKSGQLDD